VAGVLIKDWWRYRRALVAQDSSYLELCNREERLEAAPDGQGARCMWPWTSDLHAPKVLPSLGLRLMQRALADHPVVRLQAPKNTDAPPEISFIVGHRGNERLPQLLATLESIAGQQGARVECLVVEQDRDASIAGKLPTWVRHVHAPPPSGMPYCRSWAFNIGVQLARAESLVLHDNDMVLPCDYARLILSKMASGAEVVNLKRFIFYLSQAHTGDLLSGRAGILDAAPEVIVQNAEGGGSLAITRRGYDQIGGMDEGFVGWGGEDNELWERAQTLTVWPYGFLPIWHLWHPAQTGKTHVQSGSLPRYKALAAIPVEARIAALRLRPSGQLSGPYGWPEQESPCAD
jgi:GT2 family glycosyltransferase